MDSKQIAQYKAILSCDIPSAVNHIGRVKNTSEWWPMPNNMGTVHNVQDMQTIVEQEKRLAEFEQLNLDEKHWHLAWKKATKREMELIQDIERLKCEFDKADELINRIYESGVLQIEHEKWVQNYLGLTV